MALFIRCIIFCLFLIVSYNVVSFYSLTPAPSEKPKAIAKPVNKAPIQNTFSIEKTMSYVDQLTLLIPDVSFSLNKEQLQIRSSHSSEKQWLNTLNLVHQAAIEDNLILIVNACSFSQSNTHLVSICTFTPKSLRKPTAEK